jgi:hypothetical protein
MKISFIYISQLYFPSTLIALESLDLNLRNESMEKVTITIISIDIISNKV